MFDNERKQYKLDMKGFRAEHRREFWDTQTQGENLWFSKYKTDSHN
jgi:hypothetical protein